MARLRRIRHVSARLARILVGIVAFILILIGFGIAAVETGWAKNRIRDLIVRQANQYLTATLTIGSLELETPLPTDKVYLFNYDHVNTPLSSISDCGVAV